MKRENVLTVALLGVVVVAAVGSTLVLTDPDRDGLGTATELYHGLDPFDPDTNNDGVRDSLGPPSTPEPTPTATPSPTRTATPTPSPVPTPTPTPTRSPTPTPVPDTDSDGLNDSYERSIGTNPHLEDTDNDGLDDGTEIEVGSDPLQRDTDGDTLLDGAEYHNETLSTGYSEAGIALPNADPTRIDSYIRVQYDRETKRLADFEKARIKRALSNNAIKNPDGTRGMAVHFIEPKPGTSSDRIRASNRTHVGHILSDRYASLGAEQCTHALLVVGEYTGEQRLGGVAYRPFPAMFIVADQPSGLRRWTSAVHEILHVLAGELRPENEYEANPNHMQDGWLSYDHSSIQRHMPKSLANEIQEEDFAAHQNCWALRAGR